MRRLGTLVTAAILSLAVFSSRSIIVRAQAPDGMLVIITSPVDGDQLFGRVTIMGSAAHTDGFSGYTLEYNDLSDPSAPWLLVQPQVQQQVQNGVLGEWSTNMVPDGTYRLRLRVFLIDGQVGDYIVSNLKVINTSPTPVPTASGGLVEATSAAPTPGPSPTSPIVQPPSNNPSANDIAGLPADNAAEVSGAASIEQPTPKTTHVNLSRIRSAFCTGIYLGIGIFAIMFVYAAFRGRLTPYTRRLWWNLQRGDDWNDDA